MLLELMYSCRAIAWRGDRKRKGLGVVFEFRPSLFAYYIKLGVGKGSIRGAGIFLGVVRFLRNPSGYMEKPVDLRHRRSCSS